MSDYTHPQVVFDEYQIPVSIHCVRCGDVIMRRDEGPSNSHPNVMVHKLKRLSTYREKKVILNDSSISYIPMCSACVAFPIDAQKAMNSLKAGWEAELVHLGRPDEAILAQRVRVENLAIVPEEEKQ